MTTSPWFVPVDVEDPVALVVPAEASTDASDLEEVCFESLESADELVLVADSSVVSAVDVSALPTTNTWGEGVAGW